MLDMAPRKQQQPPELINPAEYLTLTEAAEELGVDRSRVVQLTREELDYGNKRLPTRRFFGVTVVHRKDLERVRHRPVGRPPKAPGG